MAEYLKSEGLAEVYYVVFSKKHAEGDQLEQEETTKILYKIGVHEP